MGILAVRAYQDPALFSSFLHVEDAFVSKVDGYSFYIFPNIEVESRVQ